MRVVDHPLGVMTGHKAFFCVQIDHQPIQGIGLYNGLIEVDEVAVFRSITTFIAMGIMTGITANGLHKMAIADLPMYISNRIHIMAFKA